MTIPGMLSMCASEGCILYQRAFVPAAVYSQPAYVTHITYRGNLVYVDGTSKYVNLFLLVDQFITLWYMERLGWYVTQILWC